MSIYDAIRIMRHKVTLASESVERYTRWANQAETFGDCGYGDAAKAVRWERKLHYRTMALARLESKVI